MTELEELRARISKLEARAEISELVSAYAVACDEHDIPRLESLLTEDAVFDSPSGLMRATGRKAIVEMFVRLFKVRGPGYHWTHDHFVRMDPADRDRATGLIYSHGETAPNGRASVAAMRYQDVYRRVAGRWMIARREIQFLYYVPASEYLNALASMNRITVTGNPRPADYPESLPAWRAFEREHGRETGNPFDIR